MAKTALKLLCVQWLAAFSAAAEEGKYTMIVELNSIQAMLAANAHGPDTDKASIPIQFPDDKSTYSPEVTSVKVLGVIGLYNKGKTWLLNKVFKPKEKLLSGVKHEAETLGLSMLYVKDENAKKANDWLLVDTAGLQRPVKVSRPGTEKNNCKEKCDKEKMQGREEKGCKEKCEIEERGERMQKNFIDKSRTEQYVFDLVNKISDAIIFVVNDYTWYEQKEMFRLVRVNYKASQEAGSMKKLMMVAHIFKNAASFAHMDELFKEQVQPKTSQCYGDQGKKREMFCTEKYPFNQDGQLMNLEVSHYGFGSELETLPERYRKIMVEHNEDNAKHILSHLNSVIQNPSEVRLSRRLTESTKELMEKWLDCKVDLGRETKLDLKVTYHETIDPLGRGVIRKSELKLASEKGKLNGWWSAQEDIFNKDSKGCSERCRYLITQAKANEPIVIHDHSFGQDMTDVKKTTPDGTLNRKVSETTSNNFKQEVTYTATFVEASETEELHWVSENTTVNGVSVKNVVWTKDKCELDLRSTSAKMNNQGALNGEEKNFDLPAPTAFEYATIHDTWKVYAFDIPGVGDAPFDDYWFIKTDNPGEWYLKARRGKINLKTQQLNRPGETFVEKLGISEAQTLLFNDEWMFNPMSEQDVLIQNGVLTVKAIRRK